MQKNEICIPLIPASVNATNVLMVAIFTIGFNKIAPAK